MLNLISIPYCEEQELEKYIFLKFDMYMVQAAIGVRVRACVRACVSARVCVCVQVYLWKEERDLVSRHAPFRQSMRLRDEIKSMMYDDDDESIPLPTKYIFITLKKKCTLRTRKEGHPYNIKN